MANLDMSELFSDPDFCDDFIYIRRTEEVDQKGRSQFSGKRLRGYGSVQPASGRTLQMLPELVGVSGTIEIWTKNALQAPTDRLKADLVIWQGNEYIVTAIPGDWGNFGDGYYKVVCTLHSLVPNTTAIDESAAQ